MKAKKTNQKCNETSYLTSDANNRCSDLKYIDWQDESKVDWMLRAKIIGMILSIGVALAVVSLPIYKFAVTPVEITNCYTIGHRGKFVLYGDANWNYDPYLGIYDGIDSVKEGMRKARCPNEEPSFR